MHVIIAHNDQITKYIQIILLIVIVNKDDWAYKNSQILVTQIIYTSFGWEWGQDYYHRVRSCQWSLIHGYLGLWAGLVYKMLSAPAPPPDETVLWLLYTRTVNPPLYHHNNHWCSSIRSNHHNRLCTVYRKYLVEEKIGKLWAICQTFPR